MNLETKQQTGHTDTHILAGLPTSQNLPEFGFFQTAITPKYFSGQVNATQEILGVVEESTQKKPCMYFLDATWTYQDLEEKINSITHVLVTRLNLEPGNCVLVQSANNPMFAASILAIWKAGGIAVPVSPQLRVRELTHIINKVGVSIALIHEANAFVLSELKQLSLRMVLFSSLGNKNLSLDTEIAAAPQDFQAVITYATDPCLIGFTSGTTGTPKATIHYHRDIVTMSDLFPTHCIPTTSDDVHTGTPSLAFTYGLGGLVCFPLRHKASVVFLEEPKVPCLVEAVRKHNVSIVYTSPVAYLKLLEFENANSLASVTTWVSGGEHLSETVAESFFKKFDRKIVNGIGTTELIHIFMSDASINYFGALGTPVTGYCATVLDDTGSEVEDEEVGYLAIKGPTGCRYYKDNDRQLAYVKNGWNVTGDLVVRDTNGVFWFRGRADDMIISSGYSVDGVEVENVLQSHPAVAECAVVGTETSEQKTIVKAYIVLTDTDQTETSVRNELTIYLQKNLARYKQPREIQFVTQLPRTITNKIQRSALRNTDHL